MQKPSHDDLEKCIRNNFRKTDHTYFSDLNHSLMEYFMRHFSRRAHRRVDAAARQANASNTSSDVEFNFNGVLNGGDDNNGGDDDDDDDEDNENIFDPNGQQCSTS